MWAKQWLVLAKYNCLLCQGAQLWIKLTIITFFHFCFCFIYALYMYTSLQRQWLFPGNPTDQVNPQTPKQAVPSFMLQQFTCVHMHNHWTIQWRNMNSYATNFKIHFNFIPMSLPKSPKQHHPFRFPDHNFMQFLFPPFTTWPSIRTAMASSLLSFYTRRIIEIADNHLSDQLHSIQSPSQCVPEVHSPMIKRLQPNADHKVKNK
jgi:hypothetical protein